MINAFIGTPGSGKSLHLSKCILDDLKPKKQILVVTNVPIKRTCIDPRSYDRYVYVSNEQLKNAKILIKIAEEYWKTHTCTNPNEYESRIRLYIDECQLLFNARDWQKNSKTYWPSFFSVHRHYGYHVVLVTQMLSSLDKQVRGLVEYYTVHRKVSNFGVSGFLLGLIFRGGLFCSVTCWAPIDEKIFSEFFIYHKRYGETYDTHSMFDQKDSILEGECFDEEEIKSMYLFLPDNSNADETSQE